MIKIFFLLLLFISNPIFAQTQPAFRFEPIYGVERTQVEYPKPSRYVTRTLFGARVLYGVRLLSAELEFSRSDDSRNYSSDNYKIHDTVERLMLGARSTFDLSTFLSWWLRSGVRASRQKSVIDDNGTSRTETPPTEYDPYAGTGLSIAVGSLLSLNLGATMIFTNGFPSTKKYDVQYTMGFSFRFGNF